jgi:ABC-type transporter MlaC component
MALTRVVCSPVLRAISTMGLVLLSLLVSPAASPQAPEQAHIRSELAAMVDVFNTQAQDLDTADPASVQYLNGFIDDTLSRHWDTGYMAQHLLGDTNYAGLDATQQQQLRQTLETTFYRYAYEFIDEYKQAPMVLGEDFEQVDGLLRIKLLANGRFMPAMNGTLYLVRSTTSWVIVDAGYTGLTYNMFKRKLYQRKFAKTGFAGLMAWLNEKNQQFFADFCLPEIARVMPGHIAALCDSD